MHHCTIVITTTTTTTTTTTHTHTKHTRLCAHAFLYSTSLAAATLLSCYHHIVHGSMYVCTLTHTYVHTHTRVPFLAGEGGLASSSSERSSPESESSAAGASVFLRAPTSCLLAGFLDFLVDAPPVQHSTTMANSTNMAATERQKKVGKAAD
jgi:hypothetical protein